MTRSVLIAYATKHGSTTQIAEKIGQVLQQHGITPHIMTVEAVKDIHAYDAFIIGSAVYVGQWRAEAARFLEAHAETLAKHPTWLFSSGPTGEGDPTELLKGWQFPEALKASAERIQPRGIVLFHGELDMDTLNFGERLIIRGIKAPVGDYRDWETIEAWAVGVAHSLQA